MFDGRFDASVRVRAGRVRKSLEEYYAEEGRSDRVRIELPHHRVDVHGTFGRGRRDVDRPSRKVPEGLGPEVLASAIDNGQGQPAPTNE